MIEAAPLFGAHLTPLAAQFTPPFRRHLSEALKGLADSLLLFGRQALELLPAPTQELPLFRRHGAPLTESLLRARPLLRRHREPPLAALGQRLLPFRRQGVPLVLIVLQQMLLLSRQRLPFPRCRRLRSGSGRQRALRERQIRRRDE